jgi:hypothetical protein
LCNQPETTLSSWYDTSLLSTFAGTGSPSATQDNHDSNTSNKFNFALITYSHMSDIQKFERFIIGAINTWVPSDSTFYVVLNEQWEETFNEWRNRTAIRSGVVDRIKPIYVDCPEGYSGESPCCKQQEGLVKFYYDDYKKEKYDWVVYGDDDNYVNLHALEAYIRALPIHSSQYRNFINQSQVEPPLILSPQHHRLLGWPGFNDSPPYNCSKTPEFLYPWAQPAIYNRAAFELVVRGLQQNGLVRQCLEFDVSHDVGNAIFHWMYSIPTSLLELRDAGWVAGWGDGAELPAQNIVVYHNIEKIKGHEFVRFHAQLLNYMKRNNITDYDFSAQQEEKWWRHVNGFQLTDTFRKFGPPHRWKEWHTMPVSDCNIMMEETLH